MPTELTMKEARIRKAAVSRAVNPLKREIARLKQKCDALQTAGALMANTMFNLKQDERLNGAVRTAFNEMQERWDRVVRDAH